jgi:hypothetical protein
VQGDARYDVLADAVPACSSSSWSSSPSPNPGSPPAPRPRPWPATERSRPQRSSSAAGVDPRPGSPSTATRRHARPGPATRPREERCLLVPRTLTATRNLARAMPPSVERTSGWSVRLPAKLRAASVMVCHSCCLAGRCCPALATRGTVDGVACQQAARVSGRANEVGHGSGLRAGSARVPGWSAGRLRLGSAMPAPSGQILHPGRSGRTRLQPARAARSSFQPPPVRLSTSWRCGGWRPGRPGWRGCAPTTFATLWWSCGSRLAPIPRRSPLGPGTPR